MSSFQDLGVFRSQKKVPPKNTTSGVLSMN